MVNTTHPEYEGAIDSWREAREVIAGEKAIKQAGTAYLPKLQLQTDDEFRAYRDRTQFFNATGRTLEGLHGMVFRKEPEIVIPTSIEAFQQDADMLGTSLAGYADQVVREVLATGRSGSLVEWDGEAENRPFFVLYQAESVINWKTRRIAGRVVLSLVVIKEMVSLDSTRIAKNDAKKPTPGGLPNKLTTPGGIKDAPTTANTGKDEFDHTIVEQIRVLKLVPNTESPDTATAWQYVVELWQKSEEASKQFVLIQTVTPQRRGKPLDFIPFVFHGPRNALPCVDKMPLADVIAVNLHHYRLSADYNHGLHFTGLPTAWVAGFDKKAKLQIGSTVAWVSDKENAKAGYLEFTGQGLKPLAEAIQHDEANMAALGARMLDEQKRTAETAETLKLRTSGEGSVLRKLAISVGQSITNALKIAAWWTQATEKPLSEIDEKQCHIGLNLDFVGSQMSPEELTALVKAWQTAAISQDTLLFNLRRGEVLPPNKTDEEEKDAIEANLPPMLNGMMDMGTEGDPPKPKKKTKPKPGKDE